ncbi:baeRF2 domain-containing protein [Streptomyces sp. NPDC003362]
MGVLVRARNTVRHHHPEPTMKLSFLDPLFATPGPWATAYLDSSRAPGAVLDTLLAQGADQATVSALEAAVGTTDAPGQALFAAHGRLVLAADLPDPPNEDRARFDDLPDALPLAVRHAPDIPYAAITITRWEPPPEEEPPPDGHDEYDGLDELDGYDGTYGTYGTEDTYDTYAPYEEPDADTTPGAPDPTPHILLTCETAHWPVGRVRPGPRLSRRIPVGDWQRIAPRLARELTELADRHAAEVVLVCRDAGDPWLSGVLVNRLPIHLQNKLTTVDEEPGTLRPETPHPHLARLLRGRLRSADQHQLDTFFAQRARHRPKSEGVAAAVTALQRRQARAVLLTDALRLPDRLWTGSDPTQIAVSAAELEAYGTLSVHEEPADAALLAAAVRTGAELIVPPSDRVPLTDGIGVVLRYRDAADMAMTA